MNKSRALHNGPLHGRLPVLQACLRLLCNTAQTEHSRLRRVHGRFI